MTICIYIFTSDNAHDIDHDKVHDNVYDNFHDNVQNMSIKMLMQKSVTSLIPNRAQ